MLVEGAIAPSYEQLRPMKFGHNPDASYNTATTFPVYPNLTDILVSPGAHPNDEVAHTLAACSGYAYGNEYSVAMIMARMGLADNYCLRISESVDAMLIRSTALLVQSHDGRVAILCFRGTEPLDFINWLIDIDVTPGNVAMCVPGTEQHFSVHGGFYRNVRAIRFEIIHALDRAINKKESILPPSNGPARTVPNALEALYITGHSLGGAMAALMTIMLLEEPAYKPIADVLKATYTFGQPMIGSPEFAAACNANSFLKRNVVRYIYNNDIIAQLPPAFTGTFAHFGQERRHTGPETGGTWNTHVEPTQQLRRLVHLLAAPLPVVTRQIRGLRGLTLRASLQDHFPRHYTAALGKGPVCTEFGG